MYRSQNINILRQFVVICFASRKTKHMTFPPISKGEKHVPIFLLDLVLRGEDTIGCAIFKFQLNLLNKNKNV